MAELRGPHLFAGVLALSVLSACAPSLLEERWGRAQHTNVERMIADPGAGERNLDPVLGLDGITAQQVTGKYRRTQAEAEGPRTGPSVINIGTGPGAP